MQKIFSINRALIGLFILFSAQACVFPGVYRIDIPQGNLVDSEKLKEVEIGMEPRQVRYLLGTPLINDTFNQDRWDYYYSVTNGSKTEVKHHVSILFAQGKVIEIKDNIKNN
jgi:outer membrane protein assembly factor BamE